MDGQMDVLLSEDKRMDGCMHGCTDGWMDGWMERMHGIDSHDGAAVDAAADAAVCGSLRAWHF